MGKEEIQNLIQEVNELRLKACGDPDDQERLDHARRVLAEKLTLLVCRA